MMYSQDQPARNNFIMEYPDDAPFDGELEDHGQGANQTLYTTSRESGSITNPERHLCILVLGPSGSGKSTFIAKASGMPDLSRIIGHGLDSHTASCTPYTFRAEFAQPSSAPGPSPVPSDAVTVTLIDTPGFNDTSRNDLDILQTLASFIADPSTPRLTGILFTHRITDNRVTGSCRLNLDIVKALAGEAFYPRVAMLTTMWNKVPSRAAYDGCEEREAQIVSSAGYWAAVAAKGGRALRFDGTSESAGEVLRYFYDLSCFDTEGAERVPRVELQRELDAGVELDHTAAGMVIFEERKRREKKVEEELEEMREEEEARLREDRARLEAASAAASANAAGYNDRSHSRHENNERRHHGHRHGRAYGDGGGRGPYVGQYQNVQGQMLYGAQVGQEVQLAPTPRGQQRDEGVVDHVFRILGYVRVREPRR